MDLKSQYATLGCFSAIIENTSWIFSILTGSLFFDLESGGDVNSIDTFGCFFTMLSMKDSSLDLYLTESNDLL